MSNPWYALSGYSIFEWWFPDEFLSFLHSLRHSFSFVAPMHGGTPENVCRSGDDWDQSVRKQVFAIARVTMESTRQSFASFGCNGFGPPSARNAQKASPGD